MSSTIVNANSILDEFNQNILKLQLLNEPSDVHLRTLNKLLSISKTFGKGLELLNSVLDCYTVDIFSDYVIQWLDCCLKHSGDNLTETKLLLIGKLIESSYTHHDISKKIVSDYLLKIVDLCLNQKKNCHEVIGALDVLISCLKRFSSWFVNHKLRIETFIISLLDNSSDAIVKKAAIAFLFLQQTGNAGTDGINHRRNFQQSLQKLCTTFHDLLDQFFENRVDINHIDKPDQEGFSFNDQFFNSHLMISVIAQRIKNVLTFIMIMIKKGFPVCKEIRPMDILNVISRGTMSHHCVSTATDNSREDYQFCLNLNNIQVQLINLLRVFILWLQNNSFPYAFVISKILVDCLKKSQNCKCFDLNVFYQETIYLTLKCWIETARSALNSYFQEQLITCILKDITPIKNSVSLKIQSDARKKTNKHKPIHNLMPNTNIVRTGRAKEKEELRCQLALNTITTLFSSGYIRLETRIIQDIYTLIMTVFNDINTTKIPPHPYMNQKCQLKLFELLVAFYEQETLKSLPFVSLSINILNNYSSSRNNDVATICKRGLNNLEKICQPISLPLITFSSLPIEVVDTSEAVIIQEESIFMDCITDITTSEERTEETNKPSMKPEIIILDNKLIIEDAPSIEVEIGNEKNTSRHSFPEKYEHDDPSIEVEIGSERNTSRNSFPEKYEPDASEISIQIPCNGKRPINSDGNLNQNESINYESEDELIVKKSRIISKNILQDQPKTTENLKFEELNSSFVDEVKE